jgi:putative sigma-54 modulation protein
MRLEVTYRNIRAADALRERAERKFQKVSKHLREPIEAHVVLRVEKHRHLAEATVASSGDVFKAHVESDDMYVAIDGLMNKLERVVRRHRERIIDRAHSGSGDATDGFPPVEYEPEEIEA